MKKRQGGRLLFWKDLQKIGRFFLRGRFRAASLAIVVVFFLFLPGTSELELLQLEYQKPLVRASEFDSFSVGEYPKKVGYEPLPNFSAEAVEIMDFNSGVPMAEVNPNERLWPASITKLMTALVAMSYFRPDQVLTVKRLSPEKEESEMGLSVGDKLSVRNLIYGLLVPSGNDAAYTLADNYPGGIENFIYSMNKKAKELSMKNTHFENPSGFDGPGHYSTARDISILTAVALKDPIISSAVATAGITLGDASGKKSYTIRNVNKLLGHVYGVDGVKTGFTDFAGQCLVTSVSRDGHRIVIVLLKSEDRFPESARLIEWTFRNFRWIKPETLF